jgi:hypothetical protein
MDISKYKELFQGVFKSYSSLLIPVAIGLVAVVVLIPTHLMSSRLRAKIQSESVSKRGNLVHSSLGSVVVKGQSREEAKYLDRLVQDANEVELLALQTTQRALLLADIFPEPKDPSMFIFKRFGEQFRRAIDELIESVNGRDCPTEAELQKSMRKASPGLRRIRSLGLGGEIGSTIVDVLCREKAESASVYVNPADIKGYTFWEEFNYAEAESRDEALKQCWHWQLGYWIIEDVVDTIRVLNSDSNRVFTSPVKRLMSISFTDDTMAWRYRGSRGRGSRSQKEAGTEPSYVLSSSDGLATPSCTRRICNDDSDDSNDVVHFRVSVIVKTDAVSDFIVELCEAKEHKFRGWDDRGTEQTLKHNQITILGFRTGSVERNDLAHEMYRYGDDAVVKLDLVCEYLFNKQVYDQVKPQAVKTAVEERLKEVEQLKARQRRSGLRRRPQPPGAGIGRGALRDNLGE